MPLKAVLFDLGLTLIETSSFPEIYMRILSRFGVTTSFGDIVRAQHATEAEFDTATYDESRRKEFWINYNISLLKKLGIEKKRVFLASQIDELWWKCSHVKVYPDVEPTLSKLKNKGLKLGVVSNGFKKDINYVLDELKLEKWFDAVACIDSCNCAKPDKEIFLYALDKLNVKSNEAIFVGDSVVHDYEGALNAEIKPLLIDRKGKISYTYNKISSLTELLAI